MVVINVTTCVRNVERLISRCEDIIGERVSIRGQTWRIPKYVESLNEMINELEKKGQGSSVNVDQLRSFKHRVSIIEEVLRQQQTKNIPTLEPENLSTSNNHSIPVTPFIGMTQHQRSLEGTDVHGSGLLRRTLTSNYKDMREELFSKEDSFSLPGHHSSGSQVDGNVETVMAKQQDMQEKIAQDMILIARSLKDHSMAARDIIKSDKEVLTRTIDITDSNIEGVNRETGRLKENNKSCSWGVWILLVIVFIVFIQMVLFIRMFPKPH